MLLSFALRLPSNSERFCDSLRLCRGLCAESPWRAADLAVEDMAEVGGGVKAYPRGDLGNAVVGCSQQLLGAQHAVADEVLPGREPELLLKNAPEVGPVDADGIGNLLQGDRIAIVLLDEAYRLLHERAGMRR